MEDDIEALFNRALRLRAEPSSSQSETEILRLLTLAAEARHVRAMGLLGEALRDRGDFEGAVSWLRLAAEAGDSRVHLVLGMIYLRSLKDFAKARECFEMGARTGDGMALANLGLMYANGIGVRQDSCKAALLLLTATGCGNEPAMQFLKEVVPRLANALPKHLEQLHSAMEASKKMVEAELDHARIATFVIERLGAFDG